MKAPDETLGLDGAARSAPGVIAPIVERDLLKEIPCFGPGVVSLQQAFDKPWLNLALLLLTYSCG